MKTLSKRVSWSHWDRFLFIVLGIVLVLIIGLVFWFRALDKNPDVSVPTPPMPANNAFNYYKAATDDLVDGNKVDWAMSKLPPGQKPSGDERNYSLAEKELLVRENEGAVQILHYGFRVPLSGAARPFVQRDVSPLPEGTGTGPFSGPASER